MGGVKNLFGFGKNKDQKPLKGDEESSESETTSTDTTTTSSTESAAAPSSSSESAENVEAPKKRLVVIPVDYSTEKLGTPGLLKSDLTKGKDA